MGVLSVKTDQALGWRAATRREPPAQSAQRSAKALISRAYTEASRVGPWGK